MHIVTLTDKTHFDYLMYVFHKHVTGGGMDPEELVVAGQVWGQLKNVQELDPASLAIEGDDKELIQIPGPLTIVHNGDLTLPVD